jgi:SAM-dependent methyltransferase
MKRTDYEDVAARYDENTARHQIPTDALLAGLVAAHAPGAPIQALDLACGTGNYLAVQNAAFGERVHWRGIDASQAMLARARTKLGADFDLRIGRAEALPYDDATFDYVSTSFAFHHFEDKPRALDEVRRVMKPGATLHMFNVEPTRMRGWWVYDFFPEARREDEKRFWSPELIHHELEQRGFDARVRVTFDLARVPLTEISGDAERRDISQLAILSADAYARGLGRVRAAVAKDPGGSAVSEIALLVVTARLRP